MSDKQTAIDWYLQKGYVLFPLKGKDEPLCKWSKAEFDFGFSPSGNFGVVLGADDLIIDVDPRNFKDGVDSLQTLLSDLDTTTLPAYTARVKTGGGGTHYYFKKPRDLKLRKNLKEYPGVDFLTSGCYVVGAGSIHPKTNRMYELFAADIGQAPPLLLDLIRKHEIAPGKKGTGYDESRETKERYREYLINAVAAIEGQSGDQTTFNIAAVGHDYGLSADDTFTLMLDEYNDRCQPPWSIEDLRKKVQNAYLYAADKMGNANPAAQFEKAEITSLDGMRRLLHLDMHNLPKKNLHNTAVMFAPNMPLNDLLSFNEFSNEITFTKNAPWHRQFEKVSVWTDGEALRCKYFLSHLLKFEPSTAIVHEAAYVASQMKRYHPVKEYLQVLAWDGHKRVHQWLSLYLGVEDGDYTRAVGLKFLVAAIKRIYEPGCKFDYVLVLEGQQGTFKSSTFEILAGKEWYCDPSVDITNKDVIAYMFGKWIIELPEMETHRRTETSAMKSFLSRNTDRCRMPYARLTEDFPRQCVFGGTINPENDTDIGWLKDSTGNRRYWPVRVGWQHKVDLEALKKVRDQLWAEALTHYRQEFPIYLDDERIVQMAQEEQKERMGNDIWFETIDRYLNVIKRDQVIITASELYRLALGGNILQCGKREHCRMSLVMSSLGWTKGVYYNAELKKPERGYKRPMPKLEEVLE